MNVHHQNVEHTASIAADPDDDATVRIEVAVREMVTVTLLLDADAALGLARDVAHSVHAVAPEYPAPVSPCHAEHGTFNPSNEVMLDELEKRGVLHEKTSPPFHGHGFTRLGTRRLATKPEDLPDPPPSPPTSSSTTPPTTARAGRPSAASRRPAGTSGTSPTTASPPEETR